MLRRRPERPVKAEGERLEGGSLRSFHISEAKERDFKLDGFKWLREESLEDADDLPPPEELAAEAISELEAAVKELHQVLALLEQANGKAVAV